MISVGEIVDEFPELVRLVHGGRDCKVSIPCSQESPKQGGIVFISNPQFLNLAITNRVAAIVGSTELVSTFLRNVDKTTDKKGLQTVLESPSPYLALAKINSRFFKTAEDLDTVDGERIHNSAIIAKSAKIASNAKIGPGAVVSERAVIGANSSIGALAYIGPETIVGNDCRIHAQVHIAARCKIGDRCELKSHCVIGTDGYGFAHDAKNRHFRIPHYGGVILDEDVHVGACTTIDAGTFEPSHIGAGTKIDNHCHFGHNIQIGKNCLFTGGQMAAGSVTIGDNCVFGGRVTFNGHIKITSNVSVAPFSGISCSIDKPGQYGGYPPTELRESQRIQLSLQQLPRMRKQLARILKNLGMNEN